MAVVIEVDILLIYFANLMDCELCSILYLQSVELSFIFITFKPIAAMIEEYFGVSVTAILFIFLETNFGTSRPKFFRL